MNLLFSLLKSLHTPLVFSRRVRVLSDALSGLIPDGASVLDIGCGSGGISSAIMRARPSLSIRGADVLSRPDCLIESTIFDGRTLPLPDAAVDLSLLVDVLHHTDHLSELLDEAVRVSGGKVLVKDHLCENRRDRAVLKFMDWVGNRQYGVDLPYNYRNREQWKSGFAEKQLSIVAWTEELPLYPHPFQALFGNGLHFIALLHKR